MPLTAARTKTLIFSQRRSVPSVFGAGKQLGEADERNLFPAAIRLISEIRPKPYCLRM